jgi:hypothetical protein
MAINEGSESCLPTARCAMRLEQTGAHHRRQRQRGNGRYCHRADQGEGEFREQRAGQTALERDRDIDRDKDNRHGDDRAAEFSRRLDRRNDRRLARLKVTVDVFDDDDGIIDHEPDRKHQRQQRQEIDRETDRQHHGEGTD